MSIALKSQAVAGARWMSLSNIVIFVLQITQMGVLARLLEPKDFGLMALFLVVMNVTQGFSDFGLGKYIISKKNLSNGEFSLIYFVGIFQVGLLRLCFLA